MCLLFPGFFPQLLQFQLFQSSVVVVGYGSFDIGLVPCEVAGHVATQVTAPLDILHYRQALVLTKEALLLDILEYSGDEQVAGPLHDSTYPPVLVSILLLEFDEEVFRRAHLLVKLLDDAEEYVDATWLV